MTPRDINAPAPPGQPAKTWSGIDWEALPHGGDLFGELHLAELETRAPPENALRCCPASRSAELPRRRRHGFPSIMVFRSCCSGCWSASRSISSPAIRAPTAGWTSPRGPACGWASSCWACKSRLRRSRRSARPPLPPCWWSWRPHSLPAWAGPRLVGPHPLFRHPGRRRDRDLRRQRGAGALWHHRQGPAEPGAVRADSGRRLAGQRAGHVDLSRACRRTRAARPAGRLPDRRLDPRCRPSHRRRLCLFRCGGQLCDHRQADPRCLAGPGRGHSQPGARPGVRGRGQPVWRRLALPWFITAFLATVALNSLVAYPGANQRIWPCVAPRPCWCWRSPRRPCDRAWTC